MFATNAGTLLSVLAVRSYLALVSFDPTCIIPVKLTVTPHSQHD
jgi:hypothetical protein